MQTKKTKIKKLLATTALLFVILITSDIFFVKFARAQNSAEAVLKEATSIYEADPDSIANLKKVRALLDKITIDFPSSDLAVQIMLEEEIEDIDVTALNQAIAVTEADTTATVGVDLEDRDLDTPVECISAEILAPATNMVLSVELDEDGNVAGVPELVSPVETNASLRKAFFSSVVALDECAPFQGQFAGKRISVNISAQGSVSVTALSSDEPLSSSEETAEASNQAARPSGSIPESNSETDTKLNLERPDIRDIQARLLVLGFDPNGVDGAVGRGTRSAIADWQTSTSLPATSFLNDQQLELLKSSSQVKLDIWLAEPENKLLYDPPIIALGPHNLNGRWQFTANCGPNSRLGRMKATGVMQIAHQGGGQYAGNVRNSQGLKGKFSGAVRGRTLSGEINWGWLFGRVKFSGNIQEHRLVVNGRDSNGCSIYARK